MCKCVVHVFRFACASVSPTSNSLPSNYCFFLFKINLVSFRPRASEEAGDLRSLHHSNSSSSSTPPPAFDDINRSGSSEKTRDHTMRSQVANSSPVNFVRREKQQSDTVTKQIWTSQSESIR